MTKVSMHFGVLHSAGSLFSPAFIPYKNTSPKRRRPAWLRRRTDTYGPSSLLSKTEIKLGNFIRQDQRRTKTKRCTGADKILRTTTTRRRWPARANFLPNSAGPTGCVSAHLPSPPLCFFLRKNKLPSPLGTVFPGDQKERASTISSLIVALCLFGRISVHPVFSSVFLFSFLFSSGVMTDDPPRFISSFLSSFFLK